MALGLFNRLLIFSLFFVSCVCATTASLDSSTHNQRLFDALQRLAGEDKHLQRGHKHDAHDDQTKNDDNRISSLASFPPNFASTITRMATEGNRIVLEVPGMAEDVVKYVTDVGEKMGTPLNVHKHTYLRSHRKRLRTHVSTKRLNSLPQQVLPTNVGMLDIVTMVTIEPDYLIPHGYHFHRASQTEKDAPFLFLVIVVVALSSHLALRQWRHVSPSSYDVACVIGLWLMPLFLSVAASFTRFIVIWCIYSVIVSYAVYLATRRKLAANTPRHVYSLYLILHKLCYALTVFGIALMFMDILGIPEFILGTSRSLDLSNDSLENHENDLFSRTVNSPGTLPSSSAEQRREQEAFAQTYSIFLTGLLSTFYGLYFGVLSRDIAHASTTYMCGTMEQQRGFGTGSGALQKAYEDTCAVCSQPLSAGEESEENAAQVPVTFANRASMLSGVHGAGGTSWSFARVWRWTRGIGRRLWLRVRRDTGDVQLAGDEEELVGLSGDHVRAGAHVLGGGVPGHNGGGAERGLVGGGRATSKKEDEELEADADNVEERLLAPHALSDTDASINSTMGKQSGSRSGIIPGDEAIFKLKCGHAFHDLCLRGWLLAGKHDTCALCGERCSIRDRFTSPWEKAAVVHTNILNFVHFLLVINPLIVMIMQGVLLIIY